MSSESSCSQGPALDRSRLPVHVAIIMDGNGRWARRRMLNRISGHEKGADTVRTIVRTSREIGISYLTLYAFSTENWLRPKAEVAALMVLLKKFLKSERQEMIDNRIRLNTIGAFEKLPADVRQILEETMTATRQGGGMVLNLALSYGGRDEIVRTARALARKIGRGELSPDRIDADLFAQHLDTAGMPDPDMLIRTSGEMRISNFLLWQIAYTEIFVTDTLWPDFGKEEFLELLQRFQLRDRRFGNVNGGAAQ